MNAFEIQSLPASGPSIPQKAVARKYHSVPDAIELNTVNWDAKHNSSPVESSNARNDLEMSRPASPTGSDVDGVEVLQSFSNPPINRYRMFSVSTQNFVCGLNDSATGALIPYMERHYDIGYALVSLIFVTTAVGFITAAFCVEALRMRIGRAKTMVLGNAIIVSGYVCILCTPPWAVVVLSFFLLGFGLATNLALGNVFAANLQDATTMLGFMHGSYGAGGIIAPLVATTMVSNGILWSRFYLLTLGGALFNGVFAGWSFWGESNEMVQASATNNAKLSTQLRNMAKAFKDKTVNLGALFIFAYQGAEVSISGWVISFFIAVRNGNPASVGYVTAGFWAGITLGRFVLSPVAYRVGEKLFVYVMVIGAAVFQLLVWQVPNVVGDAVALGIVGLLLGPVYPCSVVIFSRNIAKKEQVGSLSVISAFGSSGGAIAPFTTGILAQAKGPFVLHPIALGLFGVMMACWYGLPHGRKRSE